jgi:hypothetical protein
MAANWLEIAQKMAEDARVRLALNRERLNRILAERKQQTAREAVSNTRSCNRLIGLR